MGEGTIKAKLVREAFGAPFVYALSVVESLEPGAHHRLLAPETTLGRGADVEFFIDDEQVSTHHARVFVTGSVVEIMDLDSSNGTLLNGKRLKPKVRERLKNLDEITVGQTRILFTVNRFKSRVG